MFCNSYSVKLQCNWNCCINWFFSYSSIVFRSTFLGSSTQLLLKGLITYVPPNCTFGRRRRRFYWTSPLLFKRLILLKETSVFVLSVWTVKLGLCGCFRLSDPLFDSLHLLQMAGEHTGQSRLAHQGKPHLARSGISRKHRGYIS